MSNSTKPQEKPSLATYASRPRKRVLMMANARKFLDSVARYGAEHGWRITIVNDGLPPHGWKGDGALLSYSRAKAQMDYAARLVRAGEIPCVGMSCALPKIKVPRVLAGFEGAAELAARCLTSNGYMSFAFLTEERIRSGRFGYKMFIRHLRRLGYRGDVPWFVRRELVAPGKADNAEADIASFRRTFSGLAKPLGVWCFSDSVASRLLDAALACGASVPDEVGILATNDNRVVCENQELPLSSINCDYRGLALAACTQLDRAMAGEKLPALPVFVPPLGVSERETTGLVSHGDPLVRRAMVYLRAHVGDVFGMGDLARALGVSERTLSRVFRERADTTPAAELRALRIRKAMSLLRSTEFPLDYIAHVAGFTHASHFVNSFRDVTGETPAVWRARWQE